MSGSWAPLGLAAGFRCRRSSSATTRHCPNCGAPQRFSSMAVSRMRMRRGGCCARRKASEQRRLSLCVPGERPKFGGSRRPWLSGQGAVLTGRRCPGCDPEGWLRPGLPYSPGDGVGKRSQFCNRRPPQRCEGESGFGFSNIGGDEGLNLPHCTAVEDCALQCVNLQRCEGRITEEFIEQTARTSGKFFASDGDKHRALPLAQVITTRFTGDGGITKNSEQVITQLECDSER